MNMNRDFLWNVILMIAAIFAACFSVFGAFKTHGILPIILLVPILALLVPQIRSKIKSKFVVWPSPGWSLVFAVFLWVAQISMFSDAAKLKLDVEQAKFKEESISRLAKIKEERRVEYTKNKDSILAKIDGLIVQGKGIDAFRLASQYWSAAQDLELGRIMYRAELVAMHEELSTQGSKVPLSRQIKIYQTLAKEEPNKSIEYLEKLKMAEEQLLEKNRIDEEERLHQILQASAEGQFSKYDGSHRGLESAIKSAMKNPKSYEHVETNYRVGAKIILVETRYRGTNSFGAIVTNSAIAEVDSDGNILSLRSN